MRLNHSPLYASERDRLAPCFDRGKFLAQVCDMTRLAKPGSGGGHDGFVRWRTGVNGGPEAGQRGRGTGALAVAMGHGFALPKWRAVLHVPRASWGTSLLAPVGPGAVRRAVR